ncbi:uncharacterized protein LOC144137798 isoform X3 [Haemaphysalis longicornis]
MAKPPTFACPHCGRRSTSKGGLKKHIQNIHKLDLPVSRQRKYDCDECSEAFCSLNRLKGHYEQAHNYRPVYEERRFRTMAAFKTWKQRMESETGSRFIAQSAAKKSPLSRGKVLYLACCRSGHFKSHSTGKRKLKSQGSVKCGRRCFASMTVVEKETGVSVVFQATHRGHDLDLRHVLLSDKEKTAIASKLHKGVSLDTVLDSVRERFEGTLQRVHLLARQDLNVLADSRPEGGRAVGEGEASEEGEEDECLGVLAWVERMGREEDNPVLYFKQRGQPDCAEVLDRQPEDLLADDDFMLVLMTHPQLELLRMLGGRRICIDWTHGAPGMELQLLTVVCLDGSGGGAFPVAYCVTGQVERRSALTFLRCVRAALGAPVEAEALVSDDVPALVSAWQEVMGQPRHCFLCSWSVDQAWRESIKRRIPRKKLQAFAYKALRTVMDASTEKQLEALQEAFFTWCSLEGQKKRVLTDFMEYFRQNYAQRAKVWATCYRRSAGIGSSVRLEALHKVLEHCCQRGGESQRVDRLVPLLLRLTRNKVIDRLAKGNPNAEAHFRAETRARHEAGLQMPRENVSCAGIGQWTVRSPSNPDECFVVACQGEPCREACAFACPACQVCAHNTACSCPDSELRRNICPHIHAVFARTAEAVDVVEESLRACEAESVDTQPTAAEDGGNESEEPGPEVPQAAAGDGEAPTVCALLLHAIGQQLRHPCVQEKATPWLQPLLAAILERLNACAAANRVSLSYVVNNGVLASTDLSPSGTGLPKGGAQPADGDVARAVLSIGQQPPLPADRPAAPAVVVRTVEPPLSTNHRPILPAVKKVAEAGVSARPAAAAPPAVARVAAPPAVDPASQMIVVGVAEPPNHEATRTVPAGLAQPVGSAAQTIFVKVNGPPAVLANQEAAHPALVQVPASTASASLEATRTVFVPAAPAAPLATQNIFVRAAETLVSPNNKVVHTAPAKMGKPAGSLDQLATGTVLVSMSEPLSLSTNEVTCPVLARTSEAAASAAPARTAQPAVSAGCLGAQTIFVMGAPPQAKGDEVVCLVPLQMAEAMAANRKAAHTLPPGVARPPVPANHLAPQTPLARMAAPAVPANHEAVHTVPQRLPPKPALSVGREDNRTVFVVAEPQAPTVGSREARHAAPAEVPQPARSVDHDAVFVLADPRVSTSRDARRTVPAGIPQSAASTDPESARGVFVLSEPQVSTSRGTRHSIPAGIPKSAVSMDHEDTRTVFVLDEPRVSTSRGTKNSVPATTSKPAVSVDHEDARTVFVLAQPPTSSGHQATHSVPAILRPAVSASQEDTRIVFVLAGPEGSSHEVRLTVPTRIPKSARSLDREATRTGFALAEPRVSSHDAGQSVPARIPKPAVSVDREGARTVVLAEPPVSASYERGVPAKIPKLAGPLDPDDTRPVFVLAQPQMSTNCEATPAKTAGPALPLDREGSRIILVPVAEPPVSANHKAGHSARASVAEPHLSPGHEAAHTILTMAAAAKPAGRPTIRSILKATRSPGEARLAERAVSVSPSVGGFAFVRMAEPPASESVAVDAAEPRLSPNHEAAHTILKMADRPATSADREAPPSTPVERAGSPLPASQAATPGAFAATAEHASPATPEAVHPALAVAAEGVASTSPFVSGPLVLESHEGACNVLATAGEPALSPNSEAAHTILGMADTATLADHEATAGSPVPTVVIKVEAPEVPSSPEATGDMFAIVGDPSAPAMGLEGPCSVPEGAAAQAALGGEDGALAASGDPCSQAAADHDYCSNPPLQTAAGFTTAFPWTTNLVQHSPSSR